MKIPIKTLEEYLNCKIKKNSQVIGFDTATRCGVCSIKTNTRFATFDWTFKEFDSSDQHDMYKNMFYEFNSIISEDMNCAVIEDVFIGLNRMGAIKLVRMGTLAMANCLSMGVHFEIISASSARSKLKIDARKFGKGKSKLAVADWLKNTLNIELDDSDISDAIVLALLGIIEDMDFKPTYKKKKRKAKKKTVGKKKKVTRKVRAKSKSSITVAQAKKYARKSRLTPKQ